MQSPLAFSALHYLLVSNPLPPDSVTQQLWSPQNYAPTEDADHHPAHSDSCWFSQTTGTPGMLYWLHQVWLLVVASAVIQNTIRLLVLSKLLSFLTTVNHKLSLTAPATEPAAQRMPYARNNYPWAAACTGIFSHAQCNRQRQLCDNFLE